MIASIPPGRPLFEIENASAPNPLIGVIVRPPPLDAARNVGKLEAVPCPMFTTAIDDALAFANSQLKWFGAAGNACVVATPPMYEPTTEAIALHDGGIRGRRVESTGPQADP